MNPEWFNTLKTLHQASIALAADFDEAETPLLHRFAQGILFNAERLQHVFISLDGLDATLARPLMDFEMRSHLASIIGYAEVLLNELDAPLNDDQRQHAQAIRTHGETLLRQVVGGEA
jgi:hypothetical protein